ncbi:hypothetical protein P152DRAFT_480356 [Eremomyces bilateralis CBS 781.70]|uniref:NUC153 domain-containing protein n=1 Tax=Eremomyces bilateralis CBS 781.70 TaxID=1392243 RepID=A0A6G1G7Q2_9PEZI|nr:uncharacterized protein P152DRAFT_480356 [Eremomyces bilateralis CBS 781.70]KAF1814125.1 hypothetical protein P152DRAFT_480356 [Eremomyces bilateralis CBS 781.70]
MAKHGVEKRKKRDQSPPKSSTNDPRFTSLSTDPRFRLPSQKNTKVRLDDRFSRLLKDEDFTKKASVDRYGRKIEGSRGKKELERLYQVASASETDESDQSGSDELDADDDVQAELKRVTGKYDPAREGGFSSSEDDEDDEDVEEESEAEEDAGPQEDIPTGEVTSRLAVVNLDWDNIKAADLMAVALSFAPTEGKILNVSIYPSQFGKKMMEREETEGPAKELFQGPGGKKSNAVASKSRPTKETRAENEDSSDDDEEAPADDTRARDFDPAKLRNYQLQRLRYYYAVITASTPAAAKFIYDAMDGREYLTSANFFDLRFVPDDTSFDDDEPEDECTSIPKGYRPREFVTQALRHSRVTLTWDNEDGGRKDVMRRAFERGGELDNDLLAYLGSGTSDEGGSESEEEPTETDLAALGRSDTAPRDKVSKNSKASALRAALGLSGDIPQASEKKPKGKKEATGGMQITFVPGFSGDSESGNKGVFENEPVESTVEKYIRKERERKARRKEKNRGVETGAEAEKEVEKVSRAEDNAVEEDLGFDDPFFENPAEAAKQAAKRAKKLAREIKDAQQQEERIAKEKEKKELELLMAEEGGVAGGAGKVQHFDMNEIMKREKASRKKGKAKKKSEAKFAGVEEDTFKVDAKDPRFGALFESHEYAIDPTNPRYKGTKGMRELLDEGRQKRAAETFDDGQPSKRQKKKVSREDGEDLRRLVEKVSKRATK